MWKLAQASGLRPKANDIKRALRRAPHLSDWTQLNVFITHLIALPRVFDRPIWTIRFVTLSVGWRILGTGGQHLSPTVWHRIANLGW